ncbi:hypothetical protein [Nocardia sp. NPDC058497]|uniref:hypothetical protein n=1 Tax=Nocardia sp. NPDC058497 TaxID=3346529 RepID=UPI0036645ABB
MAEHSSMADVRRERMNRPDFDAAEYETGCAEAILAFESARAIQNAGSSSD